VKIQIWTIDKDPDGKHKQRGWDISGGGCLYLSFYLKWSKLSVHLFRQMPIANYEEMKKKIKIFDSAPVGPSFEKTFC
jgi:hypothetical protein